MLVSAAKPQEEQQQANEAFTTGTVADALRQPQQQGSPSDAALSKVLNDASSGKSNGSAFSSGSSFASVGAFSHLHNIATRRLASRE